MPKIDIDMFEESPKVGDKVKVIGKINYIDEESGEVDSFLRCRFCGE